MIEKILDNYMTKNLLRILKPIALKRHVHLKIDENKNLIIVYAKDLSLSDYHYKRIFSFYKEDAIYYLCNLKETEKKFEFIIKKYQEERKEY